MRRGTLTVESGRFVRRGLTVAVRAAAFLCAGLVLAAPALSAQGTPAGTHIRSWFTVSFSDPGGWSYAYASDTLDLVVAQVAGADLQPPRASTGAAGTAVLFAHTLTNVGNGADSFSVAGVSAHGWPVTLFRDVNSDGLLGAADSLVTGPLALAYGGITHLLVQVAVPSGGGALGVTDTVTVTATSRFDPAATAALIDQLDVPAIPLTIGITKLVDRVSAVAGDVITYTLSYAAAGGGAATSAQVADTVPAGTSYLAGTMRWNGAPLTDAAGDDAGALLPVGSGVVVVDLGPLAAGAGTVTFQVRVDPGLPRTVPNRGYAMWTAGGVSDTAASGVVQTSVLVPQLTLSKQLLGPGQAVVGQQVRYTLHYGNAPGAASVSSVALSDTLPVGLDYVSAIPAASVTGQVLGWALGTLAPGDSGVVDLVLSVSPTVRDTVWARNVATLAGGSGAATTQSAAAQLALIGPPSAAVGLDLTANVLEAGIGEVIPYTVLVRNSGVVAIDSIRIAHRLPAGAGYVPGSALGADSVLVAGTQLVLVSAAPLAPGATRSLHFAIALASAPGTVAETRAVASARAGAVTPVSAEAIAWVQVQRAWPMETRAAIGKVWLDLSGRGVQQPGDSGLAGIDIWTEDGQVATTDVTGKFSFPNLRPGRHVLRLDSRTLPAGYRVAGEEIQALEASGWTTPRVDFSVLPPSAPVATEPPAPIDVKFSAAPVQPALVRYEVQVKKEAGLPLDAMVEFSPVADSALVFVDDTQVTRYTWLGGTAIPLPVGQPRTEYRIIAWSSVRGDSATATLRVGHSRRALRVPVAPSAEVAWTSLAIRRVTPTFDAPAGQALELVSDPLPARRVEAARVSVPNARAPQTGSVGLSAALVTGPAVRIFAPEDGVVLAGDRVYVGVRGEAGASVMLFDGAKAIDSAQVRIDGVYDFVAVPLTRGPHILRARMHNSWGTVSWDSTAVHVTGLPASFASAGRVTLVADGHTVATAKLRVLDAWGVPVVQPAYVTLSAQGAAPVGTDADPSSVGLQQLSDSAGWLVVSLQPGREVTRGVLELRSGDAKAALPLEVLPEVRPLTVTGSGTVGVGASPDAYGAITARGRLDARTSLTLGLDSRRLNDGQDAFGRSADPLKESQYPILGDASQVETRTASQRWVSARLERGFDWATFGDLSAADLGTGLTLSQYRRAVTGLAAQVTRGPVTMSGFGSLTSQALRQLQIRGAGISGPYTLAAGILPGTEQVRIETRDALNPERAVATQALARFVDYEIDYTNGVVLFKQPIPATDASGNPLFIVASFEAAAGGDEQLVVGGRTALDVTRLASGVRLDSLRIGLTAVSAAQDSNGYRLVGGDVRALRLGALDVSAEFAYAERGDSTGFGTLGRAGYRLFGGALTLGASYMRIDRGFTNPANVALQPGLTEVTFKSGLRLGASEIRAEHSSQEFDVQGVSRAHTRVGIVQTVLPRVQLDAGVANDQVTGGLGGGSGASDATTAGLKTNWALSQSMHLWAEAQHHLSLEGQELLPDFWGFGGAYRLMPGVALEAGHRFVSRPDSDSHYSVSSLGVRASLGLGTEAWGSYQLAGGIGATANAAVVGLRNRLQLTPSLSVNTLFERRMGVASASVTDPVRALPFLQPEDNYWSLGAGMELLPQQGNYRLSARGEYKDGTLQSSRLVTVAGDVAFDASLALLTRQQFAQNALPGTPLSRQLSSLWGLAFRPAHNDRLNMLAKVEWTDARNPIGGGVLVSQGAEQRAIGAAEFIWTPAPAFELGARYAMRRTQTDRVYADSASQTLVAWADYVGTRLSIALAPWLSVRGDGRVMIERSSGATRWDGAPTLALHPVKGLELAAGYRFGDLSDPDFSVRGGHGFFVTLSATLTEKLFPTAAEFWRARL